MQDTLRTSSPTITRRWFKPTLWAIMGCMVISVTFYSEIPLLRRPQEQQYLGTMLLLTVPHILGGIAALLIGPLQFSTRLRTHNPKLHRILGRIYVGSVFISAPLAIVIAARQHHPHAIYGTIAILVQAGTWFITTAAALLTARNRHFTQHREWMFRSYAMTFTFILTRVFQPIPAWNHFTHTSLAMTIIIITLLTILATDLALHWRELTTRRSSAPRR